jgi:deoxycytidylate deaminase
VRKLIVLYLPVIHAGYIAFFEAHKNADEILLLGQPLIDEFTTLTKEIRAIRPETAKGMIAAHVPHVTVRVLKTASELDADGVEIVAPDEGITRSFFHTYFPGARVHFDRVFLRWDEGSVLSRGNIHPDRESRDAFDRELMKQACGEAERSSDWWRHVGAILVRDGEILLRSWNHHLPSEHTPYVYGDPRDFVEAGTQGDIATAIHAEQSLIADAAKKGTALSGASLYVNVFPCAVCAKLIASAGISTCYFRTGNAYLNVEEILKVAGVETVRVIEGE